MSIAAFRIKGGVPFGDYRLVWEPNNQKISPHRDYMRGSGITIATEETGAVDTAYIYGYVVLPSHFPQFASARIVTSCKRWNNVVPYETIQFKTYVDRIQRNNPGISLPSDVTGTVRQQSFSYDKVSDAVIYAYDYPWTPGDGWDPGDIILVTTSIYNVRNDEKVALHNMYLLWGDMDFI